MASETESAHLACKRSASFKVKTGGMCCTMTIGTGKFPGSAAKTTGSAFGPPVEMQIATTSIRAGRSAARRQSDFIFGTSASRTLRPSVAAIQALAPFAMSARIIPKLGVP